MIYQKVLILGSMLFLLRLGFWIRNIKENFQPGAEQKCRFMLQKLLTLMMQKLQCLRVILLSPRVIVKKSASEATCLMSLIAITSALTLIFFRVRRIATRTGCISSYLYI